MQECKTGKWRRVLVHEQNFVLLGTAFAAALYVHDGFSSSIRSQIPLGHKPREVEHPKKKLVRKRTRFFIGCSTSLGL